MEAQNGIYFGVQISTDHYGSMYHINNDVDRILDQVGSKGREHNTIMSLKFGIVISFKRSYN